MGPNGSGKSTLAQVLAGNPAYEVTGGTATFEGKDLLALQPEERAQHGVFLAFQYPVEIPGVSNAYFLRSAFNSIRAARGQEEVDPIEFLDYMEKKLELVDMDVEMLSRSVNMGFSGGEKKRNEILQMAVLEPKLALLDETDSGLDIDALRIVANGVNALRRPDNATIVVTHYQRLLNYIVPDYVHVLAHGRIVKSGGQEPRARARGEGLRLARRAAGSAGVTRCRDVRRAVHEVLGERRERRAGVAARDASRGDRAIRGARIPDATQRGLALHECRADRGGDVQPSARRLGTDRPERAHALSVRAECLAAARVRERAIRCVALDAGRARQGRACGRSRECPAQRACAGRAVAGQALAGTGSLIQRAQRGVHERWRGDPHRAKHGSADSAAPDLRVGCERREGRRAPAQPDRRGARLEGHRDRELRVARRQRLLHERGHRGAGRGGRDAHALQDSAREPACLPRAHDRRAAGARQPLRVVLVRDGRRALAHEHLHESRGRGVRRDAQRAVHGRRRAARRSPDEHRAFAAELLQPGDLQGNPERLGARRVQRQGVRLSNRTEDGRQADEQQPAAERSRAHRYEAAARDLRRRCALHARGDGGAARRDWRSST